MQFDKTALQIEYKNDPVIMDLLRDLPENTISLIEIEGRLKNCQSSYRLLMSERRSDNNEIAEILGSLEHGTVSQDTAISTILRILDAEMLK